MKLLSARCWLVQAKSDLAATQATGLAQCHVRYLLQQAYEKSVKALGISILSPKMLKDKSLCSAFGDYFLHHHIPMTVLAGTDDPEFEDAIRKAYPKTWEGILHDMRAVRRQLRTVMQADCDSKIIGIWTKIEGTRPSKDAKVVSYRYPFLDPGTKAETAPSNWKDWDTYQGKLTAVRAAVDGIIRRAGIQVSIAERVS